MHGFRLNVGALGALLKVFHASVANIDRHFGHHLILNPEHFLNVVDHRSNEGARSNKYFSRNAYIQTGSSRVRYTILKLSNFCTRGPILTKIVFAENRNLE